MNPDPIWIRIRNPVCHDVAFQNSSAVIFLNSADSDCGRRRSYYVTIPTAAISPPPPTVAAVDDRLAGETPENRSSSETSCSRTLANSGFMLEAEDRDPSTNSPELNSQNILEHPSSSGDFSYCGFRKFDSPRVNAAEYFVVEDTAEASETAEEIVGEMDTWEEEEGSGTVADEEGGGTVADESLLVSTVDMDFPTAVQEEEVVEEAVLSTPLDDLSDFEVHIACIYLLFMDPSIFLSVRIHGSRNPNGSGRLVNYGLRPRILPGHFCCH